MSKLTKSKIDKTEYRFDADSKTRRGKAHHVKARDVEWDSEIRGLGLRVYPSGTKTFVLSYRHEGRKRMMTLGKFGVITLDDARTKARKALAHLDQADPLSMRERDRAGETFADLAREYLERHAKAKKRSWKEDERRINQHLLKPWGSRKAKSIDASDVATLFRRIGKTAPIEANRTLALLSKMFSLARMWRMYPADAPNPATGHDRNRETKRDRWITPEELPALAAAIDNEPNESARNALWLYLLTGVRKSELLGARWDDVDVTRKVLRLPQTKSGRPHEVPLSGPALAILHRMPRVEGNPYLLPGKRKGAHLVNVSKPWSRVRKAAGVEDVRLHDLRRTVGSWLATQGNSLLLIGKVLNHSNVLTTAVYARLGQNQAADALEQMGARMFGVVGVVPSADVVPFAKRSKGR